MKNKLPLTRIKIFIAHWLYKIIHPFLRDKSSMVIKKRHEINYELDLREGLDLSMFLFGKFQDHTINSNLIKIPEDAYILDIGGNFGFMALQYARKAVKGRVISFEPTHYALARFNRNLELNTEIAKRITVINKFVSNKTSPNAGLTAFSSWRVDSINNKNGNRHPVHLGIEKSTDGVGSITLDDFCEENKIKKIDFIKIDTDGHEFEVLQGAHQSISKYRPLIIFEVGKYVMTEKQIDFLFYIEYFDKLNYKLYNVKTGRQLNRSNWNSLIPELGTIDVAAIPDVI